jgi:predicted nucleic acid-binding protein
MSNTIIIDANVVIKWVLKEHDSSLAEALLVELNRKGIVMYAPALLTYEVTNILYQNVRKGTITLEEAKEAIKDVLSTGLKLEFTQGTTLNIRALELAQRFNLPATYDAHYLALAEREQCELWTADKRLWNSIRGKLPWVRWLADYQPASPENA